MHSRSIPIRTCTGAFSALVLLVASASWICAQESQANSKTDLLKRPEVLRGRAVFQANCAACHGANGTGGMGPNLIASALVRHDKAGDLVGKVVHEGRMDKGMPAFPKIDDAQVADIAAFLHARIDVTMRPSALGASAFGGQLSGGDAAAGKTYFATHCASCHNPTGDFAGLAKRMNGPELESAMLLPRPGAPTGTVTPRSGGAAVKGTFLHRDEFSVTLRTADGSTSTFPARDVTVTEDDPLRAHRDLLPTYTNKDIHDVYAFLQTLQ